MVRLARFVAVLVLALVVVLTPWSRALASEEVVVLYFWGDGCRFCAAQAEFHRELTSEFPDLVILDYEVWYDADNAALFRETAARMGFRPSGVPTTVIGERVWVGFDAGIASEIRATVAAAFAGADPDLEPGRTIHIPVVGNVDLGDASLVVATLAIALVDGVNPCSLWVLTILLALVVRAGSRARVAAVAGTFLLVTAAIYGAFILGMYGALAVVAHLPWVRVSVAVVALVFGIVTVKDYFAYRVGPTLSIPEGRKGPLYTRMRRILAHDRSLPVVIGGTAGLAAGVAVLELPCTAGLPVLWSNLVSAAGVDGSVVAGLLGLYLLVYLLDELVIVGAVVAVMHVAKLQEHHGRLLKLVAGWLMISLAFALLVVPATMESLGGVGIVLLATVVLVLVSSRVRRGSSRDRSGHGAGLSRRTPAARGRRPRSQG
jgi:hypothetical protein